MACNGNAHFYVYDAATPHSNPKPTATTGNRLQESPPMIFLRPTGPRDHQLTVCRRHVFLMRFFGQSEDRNLCKICEAIAGNAEDMQVSAKLANSISATKSSAP
jgi:hypothetical protein